MVTEDIAKAPTNPFSKTPIPTKLPEKVGPYKIEILLEKGGMSILYLGTHPETKQPTTIKVLSPKFLSNQEIVDRFLKEAEIIAMADHPNIVKLYGNGKWEEGLYIAMEFIQGISLRQYILQTPISLKRALEITLDIAYALCHLHTHGVIHRDLKPENILVTENGVIKVIDFGIAQLLTDNINEDKEHSTQKQIIGTPTYMSPEQRENPQNVTFPSDIYSLGIIAYELILGKLCHGQIHLSLMPKGIQKVLVKALQPDIKDRYQDIVDFIVAVSNYLNSESFEKDKVIKDHLSELSEGLKRSQNLLNNDLTPDFPGLKIQLSTFFTRSLSGVYHDFFKLDENKYAIILTESSLEGSEGLISCSIFRGILISHLNKLAELKSFANILNTVLYKDTIKSQFHFNCAILDLNNRKVSILICGQSYLFFKDNDHSIKTIESLNTPLGESLESIFEVIEIDLSSLIFCNVLPYINQNEMMEIWNRSPEFNPKIWMEIFLKNLKTHNKILPEKTVSFITVEPDLS